MTQPIKNWHVVISGFLQDEGEPTGMVRIWRELHAQHSDSETVVLLRSWNDNWSDLAELIRRTQNGSPAVKIYAYSWGAGYGAMELARELAKRGITVRFMVLSDPVYHSPLLLARWMAMLSDGRIMVPYKVVEVYWFRQKENRPHGHDLIAESTGTMIHPAIWLTSTHQYMDDAAPFRLLCHKVAKQAK